MYTQENKWMKDKYIKLTRVELFAASAVSLPYGTYIVYCDGNVCRRGRTRCVWERERTAEQEEAEVYEEV